jgi:hypothetical protein
MRPPNLAAGAGLSVLSLKNYAARRAGSIGSLADFRPPAAGLSGALPAGTAYRLACRSSPATGHQATTGINVPTATFYTIRRFRRARMASSRSS